MGEAAVPVPPTDGGEGAVRDGHFAESDQWFVPDFENGDPDYPCVGNGQDRSRPGADLGEERAYAALKIGKELPTRRGHLGRVLFPASQQPGPPRFDLRLLQALPVPVPHLHEPLVRGDGQT